MVIKHFKKLFSIKIFISSILIMSIYTKPSSNRSNNVFNESSIAGNGDATTFTINLSDYMSKSNAQVTDGDLYLRENVGIQFFSEKQEHAYTNEDRTKLYTASEDVKDIKHNNGVTTVDNTLDLQGTTVIFADESIPTSKVNNLDTTLQGIQTNLANINSNDADIISLQNITTTHTNDISSIQTINISQDASIQQNVLDISSNLAKINLNKADILTNTNHLAQHDADVIRIDLKDANQDTLITNNTVLINDVSNNLLSTKNTVTVNYQEFQTFETATDSDIFNLTELSNTNKQDIEYLNDITGGHTVMINDIEADIEDICSNILSINIQDANQDATISSHTSKLADHDTSLNTLKNVQTSNITRLDVLETDNTQNKTDITSLQTNLLTKHPTINSSNKLNASYLGNGDVTNAKLSTLNDIDTNQSIQYQINTIKTDIQGLDALQDLDLVNIPALQTLTSQNEARLDNHDVSLNTLQSSKQNVITNNDLSISHVSGLQADLDSKATLITNNSNSIVTLQTSLTNQNNVDNIHNTQISDLQTQDTVLQTNIDTKQNQITSSNRLQSDLIFDVSLNETLDNVLTTLDDNITALDTNKQQKITTLNKLQSSLLNRNDNLSYVDVSSSIQSSLDTINSNISLLQGMDTTIITDIQDNFDAVDVSLNTLQTSLTNNANAISTLQGLQDGDVVSFQNINNSITNLQNTKHPLIDTDNKLNSTLINRDDSLQYVDVSSSIQTSLTNLQSNIDQKQDIIDTNNKLNSQHLDLSTTNLQYADYGQSINTKMSNLDSQISGLISTDLAQATQNTSFTNSINTLNTNVTSLQNKDTQLDTSLNTIISDMAINNGAILSNMSSISTNTANITTNASGIATNLAKNTQQDATLATIDTSLNTLYSSIFSNDVDIATLQVKDTQQDTSLNTVFANTATNTSDIASLQSFETAQTATNTSVSNSLISHQSQINSNDTDIANNLASINTINTNIVALQNQDTTHGNQITALQAQDTTLQSNIDQKQDEITISNRLPSSLVFDVSMNDTLDDLIETLDANIQTLNTTKQDIINNENKVPIANVDLSGNSLQYVDINANLQTQLDTINGSLSTLTGLQSGDTANFTRIDTSLNELKTDKVETSLYTSEISTINSQLSTLTGLQNNDIVNFTRIDASLNELKADKMDLIDTNNLLNSSLLNRDDNLQWVDINSSLTVFLNDINTDIATKHDIIDNSNKLAVSNVDLTGSSLAHVDISAPLQAQLTSITGDITNLQSYDTGQTSQNTTFTNSINANASAITNLQNKDTQLDTSLNNIISDIATNASNISSNTTNISTNTSSISSLQTQVNGLKLKTDTIDDNLNYDTSDNILTHTYNEENIFVNTLDDNGLLELHLTINSPTNYKTYNQRIIIDCVQFKGYINVLKINGNTVEIKHRDGDTNINLAPIAGYSMIEQTLSLTYMSSNWYVMSNIELFYNSNSNSVYDVTEPVITITGDTVINHEINTAYNDAGATANDNIDGDITNNIVVTGSVNTAVLGAYNITYTVQDSKGNQAQVVRLVNVVDTTNPVVTLTGPSTVNLEVGDTYTEQGATATDNSNESLTVVIAGDTVDTNTAGSYTPTYTATDSTGNSHQIGRLVVVSEPTPTLQYSNPSTEIFQFLNFDSNSNTDYDTQSLWTLSGQGDAWKNGDYEVRATSLRSDNTIKHFHSIFSGTPYSSNGKFFESRLGSHPITHHQYGTSYGVGSAWTSVGDGKYDFVHYNLDTATLPASYFQTNLSASTLTGEYIFIKFPFFLKPSSFEMTNNISPGSTSPCTIYLVASNDDITYEDLTGPVDFQDLSALTTNITTGNATGYKYFRLICTQASARQSFMFELFKIYGDIYAV